jgi:GntR family transcriptional regulator, rspAB operon transcriptional repressor
MQTGTLPGGLRAAFAEDQRDPGSTAADGVFRVVRQAIVTMQLAPGTRLTEQDMADALEVSRQPVREALLRLRESYLVRVVPRGSFVARISRSEVEAAQFVREAIELAIVGRASEGIAAHEAEYMSALLRQQAAVAAAGDASAFFALDEAFHQRLAAAAGCGRAWRTIEAVKAHMDRVRYLSLPSATPMSRLVEQHEAVLAGVIARDPEAAQAAMRAHLREIIASLPLLAVRYAELFEGETGADPLRAA